MATPASTKKGRDVGRFEWIVGALGAVIVISVLGVLGYEAFTYRDGAPVLVPTVIATTATEGGFVVRFITENRGPSTAAEVMIRARLERDGRVLEEAETTLDYVARKSDREAGVIFRTDPGSATLKLDVVSYRKP